MTVITLVPTTVAHASEAQLPEGPSSSSATPSPGNHAMGSQIKKHEHGAVTANRMQSLATDTELEAVSYTHLTLPTTLHECRSRWSPYH